MKRLLILAALAAAAACSHRTDIVIDSDANAEIDDQHAIAYTVLNRSVFRILGITVNATRGGGSAADNAAEARRVIALCGRAGRGIEVYTGAQGTYEEIIQAANAVIASDVPLEIFPARYGLPTGTWAVRIPKDSVLAKWKGLGPRVTPVEGRHGGEFCCFGDYSCDLWSHIKLGSGGHRSMFDLVVPAVVKNPSWGHSTTIPASEFIEGYWYPLPEGHRDVIRWENFDRDAILGDFLSTLSGSKK